MEGLREGFSSEFCFKRRFCYWRTVFLFRRVLRVDLLEDRGLFYALDDLASEKVQALQNLMVLRLFIGC